MTDARHFDIEEELTRRVNRGDDLMGSNDPEWIIDETGLEVTASRPKFDYEHIIQVQQERLATMRPNIVHSEFDDFRRATTGYIGLDTTANIPMTVPAVGDILRKRFVGQMMELVPWDGLSALPIVSGGDRVIAIGAPRPPAPDWDCIHQRASVKIFDVRQSCTFGDSENRRGTFSSLDFGFSFGNGQPKPGNRKHSDSRHMAAIESLRADPDIQILAGAASGE
jgi:hypothetical protein